MSIIYGYLDTIEVPYIHHLILDYGTTTNIDGSLTKVKWNSPTPQELADLVYVEMTQAEAMAFYKNPDNGWVPVV
jgi:hypothetical protein